MDFKRTVNNRTNKSTYYVDGKRVSPELFEFKELMCKKAGMNYGASFTSEHKGYTRHYHSYN